MYVFVMAPGKMCRKKEEDLSVVNANIEENFSIKKDSDYIKMFWAKRR